MRNLDSDRLMQRVLLDIANNDLRRARDRLRAILRDNPHHKQALITLGGICLSNGDLRNGIAYLSRADYWDAPMVRACERVFHIIARELARDHADAARYYLYSFVGSRPPADVGAKLASLRSAYYVLEYKKVKRSGLACAPIAGACALAVICLMVPTMGLGIGYLIALAFVTTVSTALITALHASAYSRASRRFDDEIAPFLQSH